MKESSSIGFVCSSAAWGGLEMNVLRLASRLKERGWNVAMYGRAGSPLMQDAYGRRLRCRTLRCAGKYGGLLTAARIARYAAADDVKMLTIHTNRDIPACVLAKTLSKSSFKLINVQHMQLGRDKKDIIHTWEYGRLDAWVSPLQILADGVAAQTKLAASKLRIIPFGIRLDRFTTGLPSKDEARRKLGLPQNVFVAGVVGRIDPKKGQDALIQACDHVQQTGYPLHVLIVGDETQDEATGYAAYVRRLAGQARMPDSVIFSPFLRRVEYAYAAIDLFVLTSHSETYGMVTIEAMASGLPIIATNSGGTPGIIRDNVNGLLVPPRDPRALSDALLRLIHDPQLARRLSNQARNDAIGNYSHSRQCELFEKLFAELSGL